MAADETMIDEGASAALAVAPTSDGTAEAVASRHADVKDTTMTDIRPANDASDSARLTRNPEDEDAKLDVALDETFPTSDAPSNTQPGKGSDPAPSSGYDEDAEKARMGGQE